MSYEQGVAFRRSRLPTVATICERAKELGFDISLEDADLANHSGFLPGSIHGVATGFEWYLESADESHLLTQARQGSISDRLDGRDAFATFRTGAREMEGQLATICAAVLMDICQGIYLDEDLQLQFVPDQVLKEAAEWLSHPSQDSEPVAAERRGLWSRLRHIWTR